ncbi:uncharacterized protein LOC117791755 [Drosophila innubila]|uniref:uncharacterized protein LOC117791755 n=1 Tax=Drosophila innubila TaxID=198719 RepID=UPI00148E281E|nr:uncharacterized protein LOC117791755 [Drosophila innubila]
MSTLTSARVLLIIFLIFIDGDAVHPYDIKHLERAMHHMAKGMKNQKYSISFKESNHILNEFIKFGKYVADKAKENPANTKIINGTSGQTYSMYFDFTPQKRDKT